MRAPLYLRFRLVGLLVALLAGWGSSIAHASSIIGSPNVAVASSLREAWPQLEAAWQRRWPDLTARPTFGASRTLARQIARGAPFELFLSADEASADLIPPARRSGLDRVYATGRLVLVARQSAIEPGATAPPPALVHGAERLAETLRSSATRRLAIADPEHAPYGQAAREVLMSADQWPLDVGRLITGENASQALQFVLAGAVEMALVPASLVVSVAADDLSVVPIDPDLHTPLIHRMVVLDTASAGAQALGEWFHSDEARDLLRAAGFRAPP